MERLLVAAVVVAVALAVAFVLQRRRPAPPTQGRRDWHVPTQLDRSDFAGPDRPWLVVVFTSDTCDSCGKVVPKAEVLASDEVAVDVVGYQRRKDLHERYRIEIVPTTVLCDGEGVVRRSFIGVPSAIDLWGALAEAREPGSIPEHDLHAER